MQRRYRTAEILDERYGDIDYLLGISRNKVLQRLAEPAMDIAAEIFEASRRKVRRFTGFEYAAASWSHNRLVIAKAEITALGRNPRFAVTSLKGFPPELIYDAYCRRDQCENNIRDLNALQADRLSCPSYSANFFRLLLHNVNSGNAIFELGSDTFSTTGTIAVSNGAELYLNGGSFTNFASGTLTGGSYDVAGTFKFTGAAIAFNAAEIILDGAAAAIVNQSDTDAMPGLADISSGSSLEITNGHDLSLDGFSGITSGVAMLAIAAPPRPLNSCTTVDAGGTAELPPADCSYDSADEPLIITVGLPVGSTLELRPTQNDFSCLTTPCGQPGGSLGGEAELYDSTLTVAVRGTGSLEGFERELSLSATSETHSAPRTAGDPVQHFLTSTESLLAGLAGDPDFDSLTISIGEANGFPSPGRGAV